MYLPSYLCRPSPFRFILNVTFQCSVCLKSFIGILFSLSCCRVITFLLFPSHWTWPHASFPGPLFRFHFHICILDSVFSNSLFILCVILIPVLFKFLNDIAMKLRLHKAEDKCYFLKIHKKCAKMCFNYLKRINV